MHVLIQPIGSLSKISGGSDKYVLLSCDEDTSESAMHDWLYRRSTEKTIGSHFYTTVTVIRHAEPGKYIGIIHKH